MESITSSFNNSLIIEDTANLITDWLEIGIDTVLDNETLKSMPIFGTLVGAGRIIKSIRERNLLKNIAIFINELNSGIIDKKKLEEYRDYINRDTKKGEKELGRMLILLDHFVDGEKAKLIAKVFKAFINGKIKWEYVVEYTDIINNLFISDIDVLKRIYFLPISNTYNNSDKFRIERLNSLGIIGLNPEKVLLGGIQDNCAVLNSNGRKFADIIFK